MFVVSLFNRAADNQPRLHTLTLDSLEDFFKPIFTSDENFDKTQSPTWSPFEMHGGKKKEHCKNASFLVFDIDKELGQDGISAASADALVERLNASGFTYLIHSSASSGLVAPRHKFRVVFPLTHSIDRDTYLKTWDYYQNKFKIPADRSRRDTGVFFLPVIQEVHREHFVLSYRDGKGLPPVTTSTVSLNDVTLGKQSPADRVRLATEKEPALNAAAYELGCLGWTADQAWAELEPALRANVASAPVKDWDKARETVDGAVTEAHAHKAAEQKQAKQDAESDPRLLKKALKTLSSAATDIKSVDVAVDQVSFLVGQYVPHAISQDQAEEKLLKAWKDNKAAKLTYEEFQKRMREGLTRGSAKPVKAQGQDGWRAGIRNSERGPAASDENAFHVLSNHPECEGLFVFSIRHDKPQMTRRPPWNVTETEFPVTIGDHHAYPIAQWVSQQLGVPSISVKTIKGAVKAVTQHNRIDHFKEYLDALVWDETPRLDDWLIRCTGVEPSDYVRWIASKWMISAVARTYDPGAKVDTMLVFGSLDQGFQKSSVFRHIVPFPYLYGDGVVNIEDKDSLIALSKYLVCEMADMAATAKKEVNRIKHFISAQSGDVRRSYGEFADEFPRRGVLAGTTNDLAGILNDPTGARRFWPVEVSSCDVPWLVATRDQLWAEARVRFQAGEQWWFTKEQEIVAKPHQEVVLEFDDLSGELGALLEECPKSMIRGAGVFGNMDEGPNTKVFEDQLENQKFLYVTLTQGAELLGLDRNDGRAIKRVQRLLISIGWKPGRKRMIRGIMLRPWIRK